ncbi:MAG TPA: hypothetical protein DCL75_13745, partial [Ktedonobacter sp.]|nr:hypothetical protein [Ktedonobacter sp.]
MLLERETVADHQIAVNQLTGSVDALIQFLPQQIMRGVPLSVIFKMWQANRKRLRNTAATACLQARYMR